jgi:acetyl esterase/lipase
MEESNEIYASPLASETFNDLPKALIITSENDESKDEAQLYHNRLVDDGVSSSLFEIKGIGHFAGLWAAGSDEVQEAKALVAQQLIELF